MANLSRVLLIGNLTRAPEVQYTSKGTAVTDIGTAVNRVYSRDDGERRKKSSSWTRPFGAAKQRIAQEHLKKGLQVFIEGRVQPDSRDDKATGQKRSRLRVVAENMQMLGAKLDQIRILAPPKKSAPVTRNAANADGSPGCRVRQLCRTFAA
jgi:single-strand DNA-binding protein